jgi:hypothetical protein
MINTKVTLKEEMDESAHDEPEEGQLVSEATDGRVPLLVGEGDGADGDGAKGGEEEGESVGHGVGVWDIVVQDQVQGVVGVWRVLSHCECVLCVCDVERGGWERDKEEEQEEEREEK